MSAIESVLHETRQFAPPAALEKTATISGMPAYRALVAEAEQDYEGFWARLAREGLTWHKPFTKVLDERNAPFYTWFDDGELNASYNCLDRHVEAGHGERVAVIFEADDGTVTRVTYADLLARVSRFANALKKRGIGKGDRVVIYIPMSIEGIVAMQACARIGATHSVVFGGFSAKSLNERLVDVGAVALITADEQARGGKTLPLKSIADEAIALGGCEAVKSVIVYRRTGGKIDWHADRDLWMHELVDGESDRCEPTWVGAEHPLFILYQRQRIDNGRPIVLVSGSPLPAVPSATHNYAQPWSFSELEDTVGIVRAEYDFLPAWTAYVSAGARHTNEHGDYYTPTYSSSGTTGSRLSVPHKEDAQSAEAGVRGRFTTGPVSHFVTAGASFIRIDSQSAYTMSNAFPTTLYDPAPVASPPTAYAGGDMNDPGTVTKTWLRSLAVSDTLGFLDDRVLFTLGARRQSISVDNFDYTGAVTSTYSNAITTPVFGLVVKPWRNVSIFANRSEALAQGEIAPNTARNAGQALSPYRSKQYEAGVRYDTDKYGASLALFQIEKPMAYTDPATNLFGADGTQRHRGIETAVYGEPWKGVRLIAGATYLDATLQNTAGGTNDGHRPIGVPSFLLNAGAEYDVPMLRGLTLTARWIHTGPQYLDVANTMSIQAWDRFDLGARYATDVFGKKTTFRATVRNVANKSYWSSTIGGYLTQGDPRSVWLSMTTDF